MKKQPGALEALKQAAKGLLYVSETESKLEPFLWKDGGDRLTKDRLRELAGAEEGTGVEETTLEGFLRAVPSEDRAKFDKLTKVLKEQLAAIKVYKVGDEPEKQVLVVGKTADGQWAGLKVTVVET